MAGDNNLSDYGLRDITEMEKTGSSDKTSVITEIDTYGNFQGTIRYQIPKINPITGVANRIVVKRLREMDSGDPKTLVNFLKWGKKTFPAKDYVIIVWNHGSGFRSPRSNVIQRTRRLMFTQSKYVKKRNLSYDQRGIATDDMTGNSIDMTELANALKESGFSGKNKIQLLGFDACLMNMLEVAYQMSPYANFLVGSEDLEPGDGADYTANVRSINKPRISPKSLTKEFTKNFGDYYNKPSMRGQWPITQSGIDLSLVSELARNVDKFGTALSAIVSDAILKISTIREDVQFYAPTADFDDYVDLGDLVNLCMYNIEDTKVQKTAEEVLKILKKAVVANIHYGNNVKYSSGLTIWFPETQHKYQRHLRAYKMLIMTKKFPNWNKFLGSYHKKTKIKTKPSLRRL